MAEKKYTPMMQHYLHLKKENPDAILMYRLGDFYEMFFDDAKTASAELDLVLTGRSAGVEERVPMCGIPYHAANSYISRLVKKGYSVAICEQLSDPKESKGLVDRDIIRIVTPGTYIEEDLNSKSSNWLAVIHGNSFQLCVLFCELSTGNLRYVITDKSYRQLVRVLEDQQVKELVYDGSLDKQWQERLKEEPGWSASFQKPKELEKEDEQLLSIHQPVLEETLKTLMGYLYRTQKRHVDYLQPVIPLHPLEEMQMDSETKSHLELVKSNSSYARAQSLWEFMDLCCTSMGSRLLRSWIEAPLVSLERIKKRQDAIEILLDQFLLREQLTDHLKQVYDLERLAARVSYGSAAPRDLLQLISSLENAAPILELAEQLKSYPEFQQVNPLQDLYEEIHLAITDNPPATLKDGGVIARGYNTRLDEVTHLAEEGAQAILEMEAKEKEKTGIKGLKIGYNRVFGYYIEIRNSYVSSVKEEYGYFPRQTLANATRYQSEELKILEQKILNAKEERIDLEQKIYSDLLKTIAARLPEIYELSRALSQIDVLTSLARLANEQGYVRPVFNTEHEVHIEEGRHPLMSVKNSSFVSNDWNMRKEQLIEIITGPNMGGKSTFLRQNALLVVMAQMGSYIPAARADLPLFDRIFTRIGASDDLLKGQSTFMSEMLEANQALRFATENSLVLFDEIGRGTATYDGMALAHAMLEYLESAIGAKTLFSTHYHELTALEENHEGIFNVHVDVRQKLQQIEFRYRIVPGQAEQSYGINVARLAKLPEAVLNRAGELLEEYEKKNENHNYQPGLFVMEKSNPALELLHARFDELDVDALTPRDALNCLYELAEIYRASQK